MATACVKGGSYLLEQPRCRRSPLTHPSGAARPQLPRTYRNLFLNFPPNYHSGAARPQLPITDRQFPPPDPPHPPLWRRPAPATHNPSPFSFHPCNAPRCGAAHTLAAAYTHTHIHRKLHTPTLRHTLSNSDTHHEHKITICNPYTRPRSQSYTATAAHT